MQDGEIFLPSSLGHGTKPIFRSALLFPHGEARDSLLHEGSPVAEGGGKYVIRTDVLYDVGKK